MNDKGHNRASEEKLVKVRETERERQRQEKRDRDRDRKREREGGCRGHVERELYRERRKGRER